MGVYGAKIEQDVAVVLISLSDGLNPDPPGDTDDTGCVLSDYYMSIFGRNIRAYVHSDLLEAAAVKGSRIGLIWDEF